MVSVVAHTVEGRRSHAGNCVVDRVEPEDVSVKVGRLLQVAHVQDDMSQFLDFHVHLLRRFETVKKGRIMCALESLND
jgi:hypothetical protein